MKTAWILHFIVISQEKIIDSYYRKISALFPEYITNQNVQNRQSKKAELTAKGI